MLCASLMTLSNDLWEWSGIPPRYLLPKVPTLLPIDIGTTFLLWRVFGWLRFLQILDGRKETKRKEKKSGSLFRLQTVRVCGSLGAFELQDTPYVRTYLLHRTWFRTIRDTRPISILMFLHTNKANTSRCRLCLSFINQISALIHVLQIFNLCHQFSMFNVQCSMFIICLFMSGCGFANSPSHKTTVVTVNDYELPFYRD